MELNRTLLTIFLLLSLTVGLSAQTLSTECYDLANSITAKDTTKLETEHADFHSLKKDEYQDVHVARVHGSGGLTMSVTQRVHDKDGTLRVESYESDGKKNWTYRQTVGKPLFGYEKGLSWSYTMDTFKEPRYRPALVAELVDLYLLLQELTLAKSGQSQQYGTGDHPWTVSTTVIIVRKEADFKTIRKQLPPHSFDAERYIVSTRTAARRLALRRWQRYGYVDFYLYGFGQIKHLNDLGRPAGQKTASVR